MRDFTPAERALTTGLLGQGPVGLRNDPGVRALSRRTRQTALGRIYLRRWIEEVVLPNPVVLGTPWATVAIVRPYAERAAALKERWMQRTELVHLWSAPDLLFGILFSRTESSARELRTSLDDASVQSQSWFLTFDVTRWPIPVYFDFEGVWARLHPGAGPVRYPRSLPAREPKGAHSGPERFPGFDRATMAQILDRPAAAAEGRPAPPGRTSWRADRAIRRWSELGWLERRALLDPTGVHRWISSFPPGIAWIHADLRPEVPPHALFLELGHEARIAPFFYATDGRKVVLGALSAGASGPGARPEGSSSVLTTLQRHASSIVIARESLDELRAPVFHDFGRLLRP